MTRYIFILVALAFQSLLQAQEISGKVTDTNGMPLPDVIVLVLETQENTVTDFDGNFTVKALPGNEIQFSMLMLFSFSDLQYQFASVQIQIVPFTSD